MLGDIISFFTTKCAASKLTLESRQHFKIWFFQKKILENPTLVILKEILWFDGILKKILKIPIVERMKE